MKVTRTTGAVMLAAGAVAILGFAGTALADDSADDRTRVAATTTASPSTDGTSGSDDVFSTDDSSTRSASPDDSATSTPSSSPSASDSPSASSSASASGSSSTATGTGITAAQAKTIALRATGGGRIESIEREREHGRLVWDVDVILDSVEHDIDVDATTGEVTRHRTDSDDDHGRGHDDNGDDHRGRGSDD